LDTKFALGELVRKKRIEKSWTQERLSSKAGINTRFLQKIEAGDRTPSLITIFKLASALGMTPEKIIMPVWKGWQKKQH
jgi:transcriptional regulator with XRE-family HTH domain